MFDGQNMLLANDPPDTASDISERKLFEAWFRASFYDAVIGTAIASLDGRWLRVNPALCRALGYSSEELQARGWREVTLADDLNLSDRDRQQLLAGEVASYQIEKRYVHKAGHSLWVHESVSLMRDGEGRPQAFTVQIVDISERKAAEQRLRQTEAELRALAARLLRNEEDQHRTLASELHDDLGQRLTALGFELAALEMDLPAAARSDHGRKLNAAQARVAELSDDLRRMAHQLHPSNVELLGVQRALRELCREASRHRRSPVRFSAHRDVESIPPNLALCLYRVAQECLHNVVSHSGADKVSVLLSGLNGSVRLHVTDDGVGFDTAAAASSGGLGLISIRERVRAAGGILKIESEPGRGTRVTVEIPRPRVRRRATPPGTDPPGAS
jgi:PAS domain S-box-containing protein